MRKYQLIDRPSFADVSRYERAILRATDLLSSLPEISSIYQIGGIGAPGISDIDLLVVFHEGATCGYSLHDHLGPDERYLFIHRAYGISEKQFHQPMASAFFHNYRLLFGRDHAKNIRGELKEKEVLKRQIAFEFMLKMCMVMTVQQQYRIIKIRAFLLEAHALRYDLEFLGIHSGDLYEAVQEVIRLRQQWFDLDDRDDQVVRIFNAVHEALIQWFNSAEETNSFYLPERRSLRTGNMVIKNGDRCKVSRIGMIVPPFVKGKKYYNLLHRFNRFTFTLPFNRNAIPEAIRQRFDFVDELRKYNLVHLPDFLPLVSSLKFD